MHNKLSQKNNSPSLLRQSINLSPDYTLFYYSTALPKNPVALYINRQKTIQKSLEQNHVKKKKSITNYVIGYRNSSKKLESLNQSGILLCHKRL